MFELRPEHLSMPAWEVAGVFKKDTVLAGTLLSIKAPWEGCRGCEKKGSRGHHQRCCDITGGGIEGKGPCGQTFVSLHSLEDCGTLLIPGFFLSDAPNTPAPCTPPRRTTDL